LWDIFGSLCFVVKQNFYAFGLLKAELLCLWFIKGRTFAVLVY